MSLREKEFIPKIRKRLGSLSSLFRDDQIFWYWEDAKNHYCDPIEDWDENDYFEYLTFITEQLRTIAEKNQSK